MFKALLSNRTRGAAKFSNKRIKNGDGCTELDTKTNPITIEPNTKYCLTTNENAYFFFGSENLKITSVDDEGNEIQTVPNAFGITLQVDDKGTWDQTYYIETDAEEAQTVYCNIFGPPLSDEFMTYENFAILKNEATGKASQYAKITSDSMNIKTVIFTIFNPNGVTLTAKAQENTKAILYDDAEEDGVDATISRDFKSGVIYAWHQVIDELYNGDDENYVPKEGEYRAGAEFTLKGKDTKIKLPEKIIKLTPGQIYSKSTPDASSQIPDYSKADDKDDADSLGPGAIAGIVIGCVAAVGIIGFCVYWFVLRKKPVEAPAP